MQVTTYLLVLKTVVIALSFPNYRKKIHTMILNQNFCLVIWQLQYL